MSVFTFWAFVAVVGGVLGGAWFGWEVELRRRLRELEERERGKS